MKMCKSSDKTLLNGCFSCVHETQCYSEEDRGISDKSCKKTKGLPEAEIPLSKKDVYRDMYSQSQNKKIRMLEVSE